MLREGRAGIGLLLRKVAQYIDVRTSMAPLFRYMRWSASRTPNEIYLLTLDPAEIDRMKLFPPDGVPVTGPEAICGAVGGPWDRLTLPVANHYLHQSIREHLESGVPWSETQIYDHPKYEDDPERARRRCEKIERLIESMAEHGYRRQLDPDSFSPDGDADTPPREWIGDVHVGDAIIVGLDRSGDPIHLKNGRHRLAVAQLLDVDRISVVVSLYHPRAKAAIPPDAELLYSA